ncbi:hypothetical protein [Parasphingopyxis lamellibrachiae]|uniref:Uncharacterized protein n=1 Tax=Parasphingopyxis lamellibrachiae TaxID=680125 RepID=A0A3D9FIW5_9SPHN|nr:hypothetical protein [Parasphingopyxis lamellibrachiae]RED17026.1 hypothetical protein DFR46_2060 [Parasphingopyxis lamellibrachiae]
MTEVAANVPNTASSEDITGELRRIFDAPQFNHSPVMCRLLSYLVEQTLAGNGHRLKAYTIAVDGLGRDADFDARIDSYPRVQVGRLRKLLDDYYAADDAYAGLRINIPKGAYVVSFGNLKPAEIAAAMPERARPQTPRFRMAGLAQFAAAALVAGLVGLLAWQTFGGLARADRPPLPAAVQTGEAGDAFRRCAKLVGADRCRPSPPDAS